MPQNTHTVARTTKFLKRDAVIIEGRAGVGVVATGAQAGGPSLAVAYEDDVKQIIEVRCACGQRIRIVCEYDPVARGGERAS